MKRHSSPLFRLATLALAFLGVATEGRAQTILPDPTEGQAYAFAIVTNPPQPAGTTYTADGLPPGLSMGTSSGVISGVTDAVGLYKGTLYLSLGTSTSPFPYQITVDPAPGTPTITSGGGPVGTVGIPFAYTIEASDGPTSYNIAQLPPGPP